MWHILSTILLVVFCKHVNSVVSVEYTPVYSEKLNVQKIIYKKLKIYFIQLKIITFLLLNNKYVEFIVVVVGGGRALSIAELFDFPLLWQIFIVRRQFSMNLL